MLLQLPLLVLVGWFIPLQFPIVREFLDRYDPHAAIAVVFLVGFSLFWMLPVNLDLVVSDTLFRMFKVVSVPLFIGLGLKWVWLCAHPILKIVVLFELWAAITRLGWLFLESPEQLCSNYLIGEQRIVGTALLGVSLLTGVAGLLIGIFGVYADAQDQQSVGTADIR